MSGFSEYESYDGLGLAELIRQKAVTPDEVLDAAIAQVEARNPLLNAVVMELYDHARQAIAAGLPDGPFSGVPASGAPFGVGSRSPVPAQVSMIPVVGSTRRIR